MRFEAWSYHDGGTSFLFTDGRYRIWEPAEVAGVDTIPAPYQPTQFQLGASPDQVAQSVGVEWTRLEGMSELLEGADLYAAPQLIVGYIERELVYVEALAIEPGDEAGG